MKAIVLASAEEPIVYQEIEKPVIADDEVLVQINAAALNRRDYWITIGKYAGIKYPSVLGSDGAGEVVDTGIAVDKSWLNREVIINPSNNWGPDESHQGRNFTILGLPENGTLAEYVKVMAKYIYPKPAHLSWEHAAALPLAGLTTFRALFTKGKAKKGDKVLVTGVGGGTGVFTLQWAVAAGCEVFVTSGSEDKLERARHLGAAGGANYHSGDWAEQLKQVAGGFDVIIDSALGDDFDKLLDLANPGGRIIFFGGTAGNIPALNGRKIFWKQLQILGTTMGSEADFKAMVDFTDQHQIVPVIDEVFLFAKAAEAFKKLADSSQFGKIVLKP